MKTYSKKATLLLFIALSFISHTSTKRAPLTTNQQRHQGHGVVIYVAPQPHDTPHQNSSQNISWSIYAYPLVDVICQELICAQRTKKTDYHTRLKDLPLTVLWGAIKEIFIRTMWDNDYKKSAIVTHLILQNLCLLRRTPTTKSFKKMIAESACKTLMPPLLLNARNLRANALHRD